MKRSVFFWALWVGFIAYAAIAAPPDQPDTVELITNLSTGQWDGINPVIISLFNIMGIWPLIYCAMIFADGRSQRIPAWPFAAVSFGLGAFALLPYFALRKPNTEVEGDRTGLVRLVDSRILGILLTLAALTLVGYAVVAGDWSDYIQQWQTSRFIHVMSLDFCALCGLVNALVGDDMARRSMGDRQGLRLVAGLVPLFGILIYLCVRSPLPSTSETATGTSAEMNLQA